MSATRLSGVARVYGDQRTLREAVDQVVFRQILLFGYRDQPGIESFRRRVVDSVVSVLEARNADMRGE